jgi:hypothetical protein
MNRTMLAKELKTVGVTLNGWMPVMQCDVCDRLWEPFKTAFDAMATLRFDYWRCPNGCNASAKVHHEFATVVPNLVEINGITGMVFGADDVEDFERYVYSLDATQVPNR